MFRISSNYYTSKKKENKGLEPRLALKDENLNWQNSGKFWKFMTFLKKNKNKKCPKKTSPPTLIWKYLGYCTSGGLQYNHV